MPNPLLTLGFLTILDRPELGLFGGYLVLNSAGRPLEFHCTAPVKANRAQEILYGPTLRPYLYGEQIGQTLLGKSKAEVQLVFTDVEPALAVRDYTSMPVALVLTGDNPSPGETEEAAVRTYRLDPPHDEWGGGRHPVRASRFELAGQPLAAAASYPDDAERVRSVWSPYAADFDLAEPFQRIREAIEEAQRVGK